MADLNPINNRLLVKMDSRTEVTQGGIIVPEVSRTTETWGEVVAVGDKCEYLNKGDRVMITKLQGTHYTHEGEDFIVIDEPKIICKEYA
tara:strand:+ start:1614 stop:1880 length:267 start_codon:yes stop_codon:yes gene_type:complete